MESVNEQAKKPRVRKRSVTIQIQEVLNSAQSLDKEPTNEMSIARMKFLQARLKTLTTIQARERSAKLEKAYAEVARLTAENTRLKQESRAEPTEPLQPLDKVAAALLNAKREGL